MRRLAGGRGGGRRLAAARRRRVRPARPSRRRRRPPSRVMVLGRGLLGLRSVSALGAACARRSLGTWTGTGQGLTRRAPDRSRGRGDRPEEAVPPASGPGNGRGAAAPARGVWGRRGRPGGSGPPWADAVFCRHRLVTPAQAGAWGREEAPQCLSQTWRGLKTVGHWSARACWRVCARQGASRPRPREPGAPGSALLAFTTGKTWATRNRGRDPERYPGANQTGSWEPGDPCRP